MEKVYNTGYSQAVTHPSTNPARRCLTSVIRRELVLSAWYGRRRQSTDIAHIYIPWPHHRLYTIYTVSKQGRIILTRTINALCSSKRGRSVSPIFHSSNSFLFYLLPVIFSLGLFCYYYASILLFSLLFQKLCWQNQLIPI